MISLAVLASIAACSNQSADPRAAIWDLERVPLSDDLRPHLETSLSGLYDHFLDNPNTTLLKQWCRLNLSCERPATRQAAFDSLFHLLQTDAQKFLWIDLINQNAYLIDDRQAIGKIDNTPPWNDSSTAWGAYWKGCSFGLNMQAEPFFQQAATHAAELDSLANILLKLKLAGCESRHAKHSTAIRLLLKALPTARATGGAELELLLWQDIARYLTNGGHLDDALHAAILAMVLAEKADNPFRFTESRLVLSGVLVARRETEIAQEQLAACFAESEAADFPFLAKVSRSEAAALASTLGDHEVAIRHNQEVLNRVRAEGDWFNEPHVMVNIADDYRRMGKPDSSLAILRRASRLVHDSASQRNIAEFQIHEAEHYSFVGDYARAESLLTAAGNLIPSISPAQKEATFLATQLKVAMESDRADLAFRTIARIQEMGRRFFDERVDQNVMADLKIATADLLARQGEFRRAAEALELAKEAVNSGGGQDQEWDLYRSLGELATRRDDLPAARDAFARCLEIATLSGNQDLVTRSRFGLGWTLTNMGEFDKVRELFPAHEDTTAFGGRFRTFLTKKLLLGTALSREGDPASALEHIDSALDRCTEFSPSALVANLCAERGLALIALGRLREGESELLASQKLLTQQPVTSPFDEMPAVHSGNSRAVAEHLLSLWYAHPELLGGQDPPAATLAWVGETVWQTKARQQKYQNEIGSDDSLVLIYFVGGIESFLWSVNGGHKNWIALPGRATLQELLEPVLFDLIRPGRQVDWSAGERVSNILLGAVEEQWVTGMELRILADDILGSVPWLALPMPGSPTDGETTLVLDRGNVWILPGWPLNSSARTHRTVPHLTPADISLLAVGYDGDGTQGKNGVSPNLRQAEAEALRVADLWPNESTEILVGEDASWSSLRALDLRKYGVIHLSSHVVAFQGAPERSTLRLGGNPGELPLVIPEIYQLDLDAELVFLSCCEAAMPLSRRGGGVRDFAGAFVGAGASAVIASGQIVDDEASSVLASRFYHHWFGGRDKATALRAALQDLRGQKDWEHPFFWGNYRIIGY